MPREIRPHNDASSESSPIHHVRKIKVQMSQLIDHLREDLGKFEEPKAQALFETSAEVLIGLRKAFEDYEAQTEEVWTHAPVTSRANHGVADVTGR